MADSTAHHIQQARLQLIEAKQLLQAAENAIEAALNAPSDKAPTGHLEPPVQLHRDDVHRREHRFGRSPIIDSDRELRAFIRARLDIMTFAQIAQEVQRHFPKNRHVARSTIHSFYQRTR